MLGLMPNLESLVVRRALFSLEKVYLERLQANFAIDNVVILQNIVKKLQTGKIKLTGNCNFDSLAEKIDRSVGVSLPRSPKWYIPFDDIGHESYMQLWK
ncbi:hypothetical protein HA402_011706 [Bradysia odoriphaga]|nr:hypothetical protein HA402_011706 [Bradysia odoriphaga]